MGITLNEKYLFLANVYRITTIAIKVFVLSQLKKTFVINIFISLKLEISRIFCKKNHVYWGQIFLPINLSVMKYPEMRGNDKCLYKFWSLRSVSPFNLRRNAVFPKWIFNTHNCEHERKYTLLTRLIELLSEKLKLPVN